MLLIINLLLILLLLILYWVFSKVIDRNLLIDISLGYKFLYLFAPIFLIIINIIFLYFTDDNFIIYIFLLFYSSVPTTIFLQQVFRDFSDRKISEEIQKKTIHLIQKELKEFYIDNKIIVVAKKRKRIIEGHIIIKFPDKNKELEKIRINLQEKVRHVTDTNIKLIFDYKFSPKKKIKKNNLLYYFHN